MIDDDPILENHLIQYLMKTNLLNPATDVLYISYRDFCM